MVNYSKISYSSEQISNMNAQYQVHTFSHTPHFKGLGSLGEKSILCSPRMQFLIYWFFLNTAKTVILVQNNCSLFKCILKSNSCDSKAEFSALITPVLSVTWSFRIYLDMLIWYWKEFWLKTVFCENHDTFFSGFFDVIKNTPFIWNRNIL